MPMYYFDLSGDHDLRDTAGAELPNDGAAYQEAILRSMMGTTSMQFGSYPGSDFIVVRDDGDRTLFRVAIRR